MQFLRNNSVALNQLCRVSPVNGETKISGYETFTRTKADPRNHWTLIAVHIYIGLAEATMCHFAHSFTRHAQLRRPVHFQGNRSCEQNGTAFVSWRRDHRQKPRFHVIIEALGKMRELIRIPHDETL
jgi:hypothetical protein